MNSTTNFTAEVEFFGRTAIEQFLPQRDQNPSRHIEAFELFTSGAYAATTLVVAFSRKKPLFADVARKD